MCMARCYWVASYALSPPYSGFSSCFLRIVPRLLRCCSLCTSWVCPSQVQLAICILEEWPSQLNLAMIYHTLANPTDRIMPAQPKSEMDYTVRQSARARHVWLRFSPLGELIVVVPKRFDVRRIPGIVEQNCNWITRAATRVKERREALDQKTPLTLPSRIDLPALALQWIVEYRPEASMRVTLSERESGRLVLSGKTDDHEACQAALLRWLHRRARDFLVPELTAVASQCGFSISRVMIRSQRTRWGSCSRRGTISLNVRLLFVSPDLVRHVMLHELCHTKQMNHSPGFWSLLEQHDPRWRDYRRRLRATWQQLPAWLNRTAPS